MKCKFCRPTFELMDWYWGASNNSKISENQPNRNKNLATDSTHDQ